MAIALTPDRPINGISETLLSSARAAHYAKAEEQFIQLLRTENLDQRVSYQPELISDFSAALTDALEIAYSESSRADAVEPAQLFLQRILYQINRLNFFWYSDLSQYENERSYYLQQIRESIEAVWQPWELSQINVEQLQKLDVKQALIDRCKSDLQPPLSESKRYIQEQMTLEGYRHLIAIASLDGLVESSRLCNILGGASNEIQATLIRVLIEEYGGCDLNLIVLVVLVESRREAILVELSPKLIPSS